MTRKLIYDKAILINRIEDFEIGKKSINRSKEKIHITSHYEVDIDFIISLYMIQNENDIHESFIC